MASGRESRLTAFLIAGLLLLSSCAGGAPTSTSNPVSSSATSSTPGTTTTTTIEPATTTTMVGTGSGSAGDLGADVRTPDGLGPFPAVVLVHGGGWVAGDPSSMSDLAAFLTENGYLTVNTPYQLADEEPGFPGAVDDVACAVRLAASHPDSNGSVTVLGHSAGAHLSAVVAFTGDRYGEDCPFPEDGLADRLVGLAGPYDVERLGLLMLPFFGGGPDVVPDAWEAGNPINLVEHNTDLSSLIMYGEEDALVESSFATAFHQALIDAGGDATLELVEEARHMDLRDPGVVGELIVAWLERER